jgi:hypothetical protein
MGTTLETGRARPLGGLARTEKGGQEEAAAAFVVVEEEDVDVDVEDVEGEDDEEEEESLEAAGVDSGFLVAGGSPDFSALTLPARESLR